MKFWEVQILTKGSIWVFSKWKVSIFKLEDKGLIWFWPKVQRVFLYYTKEKKKKRQLIKHLAKEKLIIKKKKNYRLIWRNKNKRKRKQNNVTGSQAHKNFLNWKPLSVGAFLSHYRWVFLPTVLSHCGISRKHKWIQLSLRDYEKYNSRRKRVK